MNSKRPFSYICKIQYLGFRYRGWQKQPNARTIQGMLDKSIASIFPTLDFQTLGASRTDAGVSCENGAFQIFSPSTIDPISFLIQINQKLPGDIKVLNCKQVPGDFNLIANVKAKEYHYRFYLGNKIHPFDSSNLVYFDGDIDLDLMKKAAQLFVGKNDFTAFTSDPTSDKNREREVFISEIISEMETLSTHFSNENVWIYRVKGNGFLRHQVRIMMGALLEVGMGKITLEEIKAQLHFPSPKAIAYMTPPQGLILHGVDILF
jgi:tRNA pseudouridine38-40 synthase